MTVSELIAALRKQPKHAEVVIKLHDSEEVQGVVLNVSLEESGCDDFVVVVSP